MRSCHTKSDSEKLLNVLFCQRFSPIIFVLNFIKEFYPFSSIISDSKRAMTLPAKGMSSNLKNALRSSSAAAVQDFLPDGSSRKYTCTEILSLKLCFETSYSRYFIPGEYFNFVKFTFKKMFLTVSLFCNQVSIFKYLLC